MQPREVITVTAIEKTFLPNVNVEEAQERPEGKMSRKQLQATAALDRCMTQSPGAFWQKFVRRDARLPIGITIVFLHENFNGWKSVMIDLAFQSRRRPLHHDVLVHFVVAAFGVRA